MNRSTCDRSRTSHRAAYTSAPIDESVVSVRRALDSTSRPSISYQQKATLAPRRPNSIAIVRPSPVAPPVTTATRPCPVSAIGAAAGSGSVDGPAVDDGAEAIHGSCRPPKERGIVSEATGRPGGEQPATAVASRCNPGPSWGIVTGVRLQSVCHPEVRMPSPRLMTALFAATLLGVVTVEAQAQAGAAVDLGKRTARSKYTLGRIGSIQELADGRVVEADLKEGIFRLV